MIQDGQFQMSRRTPEHPPMGVEGENRFNEALSGVLELALLGRTTPIDFIRMALDEMEKMNLELDDFRVDTILKHALGSREQARERIYGMSEEAFNETYPDVFGRLVKGYIEPPSEE